MQHELFPTGDNERSEPQSAISREVLNEAQYEAVTHGSGPLLVIAGAGSGKTRTLVYRVAHLIEQRVPPEYPAADLYPQGRPGDARAGRPHQLTAPAPGDRRHLSRHGQSAAAPPRTSSGIQLRLHHHRPGRRRRHHQPAQVLAGTVRRRQALPLQADDLQHSQRLGQQIPHLEDLSTISTAIWPNSSTICSGSRSITAASRFEHGLMDYDDLLVNWRRLLKNHPGAARR